MDGEFHWDVKRKVISRTSSVGCSSRSVYYCRKAEGVPFEWETQPGMPKDPTPQEILPPLSPPPAVLSLGLPKPRIEHPKPPSQITFRFWKKSRKSKDSKRSVQAPSLDYSNEDLFNYSDKLETFSFFSSDCECIASCDSTSSSSSSPSSLTESLNVRNLGRVSFERPSGCSPWQIKRILIRNHC